MALVAVKATSIPGKEKDIPILPKNPDESNARSQSTTISLSQGVTPDLGVSKHSSIPLANKPPPIFDSILRKDVTSLRSELLQWMNDTGGYGDLTWHGHSPLSLAIALNHLPTLQYLIQATHGIQESLINCNPLHGSFSLWSEAVSIGNRSVLQLLYPTRKRQWTQCIARLGRVILESIHDSGSDAHWKDGDVFYLDWKLESQVPLLSTICPSDRLTLTKTTDGLCLDATLVGFEALSWLRGHISLLLRREELLLLDHDTQTVERLWPPSWIPEPDSRDTGFRDAKDNDLAGMEEDISIALNTRTMGTPSVDLTQMSVRPVREGFWGFQKDKVECVGGQQAHVYRVEGIKANMSFRTEHLTVKPLPVDVSTHKAPVLSVKDPEPPLTSPPKVERKWTVANPDSSSGLDDDDEDEVDMEARLSQVNLLEHATNYKSGQRNIIEGEDGFVSFSLLPKRFGAAETSDVDEWCSSFASWRAFRPSLTPLPEDIDWGKKLTCANGQPIPMHERVHLGRPWCEEREEWDISATVWVVPNPEGEDLATLSIPLWMTLLADRCRRDGIPDNGQQEGKEGTSNVEQVSMFLLNQVECLFIQPITRMADALPMRGGRVVRVSMMMSGVSPFSLTLEWGRQDGVGSPSSHPDWSLYRRGCIL